MADKITDAPDEGGFDLDDILDNVSMSEDTVTLYLDPKAGEKAVELKIELEKQDNGGVPQATSITDENPAEVLRAELGRLKAKSLTVTQRALSSAEITAARRKIVAVVKIDKNLSPDEKAEAENERTEKLYENLISRSIIKIVDNKNHTETNHLTPEQVSKLRFRLPENEWEKLKGSYLAAGAKAQVVEAVLDDPSFRGSDADEDE